MGWLYDGQKRGWDYLAFLSDMHSAGVSMISVISGAALASPAHTLDNSRRSRKA